MKRGINISILGFTCAGENQNGMQNIAYYLYKYVLRYMVKNQQTGQVNAKLY